MRRFFSTFPYMEFNDGSTKKLAYLKTNYTIFNNTQVCQLLKKVLNFHLFCRYKITRYIAIKFIYKNIKILKNFVIFLRNLILDFNVFIIRFVNNIACGVFS